MTTMGKSWPDPLMSRYVGQSLRENNFIIAKDKFTEKQIIGTNKYNRSALLQTEFG